MRTTTEILDHHLEAFGQGVQAILADYADDAVILTPEGPIRGHKALAGMFEFLLHKVFTESSTFELLQKSIEGDVAYIAWRAESEFYKVPLATDTYVIRDGKIAVQTFAAKLDPQ